jgi:hypothetical protein
LGTVAQNRIRLNAATMFATGVEYLFGLLKSFSSHSTSSFFLFADKHQLQHLSPFEASLFPQTLASSSPKYLSSLKQYHFPIPITSFSFLKELSMQNYKKTA